MSAPEPVIEAQLRILLNVLQELWVIKDRQIVLEQVLAEAGIDAARLVDDHQPDAELAERLDRERKRLLERCLAPAHGDDA